MLAVVLALMQKNLDFLLYSPYVLARLLQRSLLHVHSMVPNLIDGK